jgi:hypothetical protein
VTAYPDRVPGQLPDPRSFQFDATVGAAAEAQLDDKIRQLEAHIDELVDRVDVDYEGRSIPIIKWVLNITRDPDKLEKMGKVLTRLGPWVKQLDELKKKKSVVEYSRANPQFVAWAFGAFPVDDDELTAFLAQERSTGQGDT